LDPALRVIVEAGYDRTKSPGEPTPFNLLYFPNPAALGTNFLVAVPTGLDNGLAAAGVGRALGTTPVTNPYGVGAPDPKTGEPAPVVAPVPLAATNGTNQLNPTDTTTTGSTPPVISQQAAPTLNPTDTTTTGSTPPVNNLLSTQPQPGVPLVTKPQLPIIRGPIVNGSSSLPGANGVASSVNGALKKATTAVTDGINSVTSAAKNVVSAATAKSSDSSSPKP
jgi:hypothetical protein